MRLQRSARHSFWLATNLKPFETNQWQACSRSFLFLVETWLCSLAPFEDSDWTGGSQPFLERPERIPTDLSSFLTDLAGCRCWDLIVLSCIWLDDSDHIDCNTGRLIDWCPTARHKPEWSFCQDELAGDDESVCRDSNTASFSWPTLTDLLPHQKKEINQTVWTPQIGWFEWSKDDESKWKS